MLQHLLFPGDGLEAIALALCGRLLSEDRIVYCVNEIIEIPLPVCTVRSGTTVRWNVQNLVPVLEKASRRGLCVLKIHSHPTGFEMFSKLDDQSDMQLVDSVESILEHSSALISAFMVSDGTIRARMVRAATGFETVGKIVVVGDTVKYYQRIVADKSDGLDVRTRQAFGSGTSNLLRSLSVGVVGCSGTGSWVVEMLGRFGVGRLILVDPDSMEEKNLNRIVNSTVAQTQQSWPKVEVLANAIQAMGFGTTIQSWHSNLNHSSVIKALAGCDILFGCMDSADGRDMLNRISTYYLVPYIDVGVRLDADGVGGIEQICCAIHYLIPGGSSLLSRGVITSEQVRAQAMQRMDPDQYASLKQEGYIKGAAVDRPAVVSINGFAASHAVNEMLARLHPYRREPYEEFRYQLFSLSDGAWLRLPDGPSCKLLERFTGRGDTKPLLGYPALS
jgi:hypothetical protein